MNERSYKVLAVLMVCLVAASSAGVYYAIQDQEDEYVSAQPEMLGSWTDDLKDKLKTAALIIGNHLCPFVGDYYIYQDYSTTSQPSASSDSSVKVFAREAVKSAAANDFSAWCVSCAGLVNNNSKTWTLAESYTDRAAEIAAGSYWSAGATYDAETILLAAGIYTLASDSLYNSNVSLDYGVRNIADRLDDWTEAYESITESLVWEGGSTSECNTSCTLHFVSIAVAQDRQRAYLGGANSDSPVWVLSSSPVTITTDAGTSVTLQPGENASNLTEGWYTLSAGTYGGLFLPSPNGNSASVSGGAIIEADESYGYVTVSPAGLIIQWNGTEYTTPFLQFSWSSDGNTFKSQSVDGKDVLALLISNYSKQFDAIVHVISKAAQAGQVMWTVTANAGESNIFLSPSSVSPQLTNVGIDANQAYSMYVLALSQISDYWKSYGTQLSASQTKVSAESLQLYVKGSLYNSDGTVILSNAVFTPYVYLKNMSVLSGTYNTFNQDGTCMVWTSEFIDDLSEFTGSEPENHQIVIMPEGSYFLADEMMYDGHVASDLTLHVKEVGRISILSDLDTDTPQPPKVLDADVLCMIIVLELGALIAAIGLYFRQPLIIVAGAVVALLGIVAKDWVADLMLEWFGK